MRSINTSDLFNAFLVTDCTLSKYYWLAKLAGSARGTDSVHASRLTAIAAAEEARTRGARFMIIESPALFFSCDDGTNRLRGSQGLLVTEHRSFTPMATHGAVSLERLDVRSVIAQFTRSPTDLLARQTDIDMPVIAGQFRAWRSYSTSPRKPLGWKCVNPAVKFDTSHLESLRMRFSQQVRSLREQNSARTCK